MIKRHSISWGDEYFSNCTNIFKERFQKYLFAVKQNNKNLSFSSISESLIKSSWFSIMSNQPKSEVVKFLQYSLDFGIAHFQKTMNDGKQITINLNGEEFEITGKFTTDGIDLGSWTSLFEKATILRNKKALQFLAEIPHEFMMQNEQSHDDYVETQYVFYKNIISQEFEKATISFELLKNIQFNPKSIVAGGGLNQIRSMKFINQIRLDFVQNVLFPINKLFYLAFQSQEKFNATLEESIVLFQQNITLNKNEDAWSSWISKRHLAACAFAHDQGINITVESDYIPKWLYEGNWEEEV